MKFFMVVLHLHFAISVAERISYGLCDQRHLQSDETRFPILDPRKVQSFSSSVLANLQIAWFHVHVKFMNEELLQPRATQLEH